MKKLNISSLRSEFEQALGNYLLNLEIPIEMLKPMLYSLNGGGKRLRPLLLLATLSISDPQLLKYGMSTAIALEYIHTYSLIHDDLPAMDNDDLRRGNPTSHVQFDEATAILAGDAILTDAFGIIVNDAKLKAKQKVSLIANLAQAAGSNGMVAGQLKDIQAEGKTITIQDLADIHRHKTGSLFNFSLEAAAIIINMDAKAKRLLDRFGDAFGIAYQIHNDIMDVTGTQMETGKHNQADAKLQKATYPSIIGIEASYEALYNEVKKAKIALKRLSKLTGQPYHFLEEFLDYLNLNIEDEGALSHE